MIPMAMSLQSRASRVLSTWRTGCSLRGVTGRRAGGHELYGYGPDNRRLSQSKLMDEAGATQEIVTF